MMTSSQDIGSEIPQDHRALLFDKARDILSIPVSSHESYAEPLAHDGMKGHLEPGRWNGFYVLGINPENGFELKARIEHNSSGDYYGSRSFFIGGALYTVTPKQMKMNDLDDLNREINRIDLQGTDDDIIKHINEKS